jgi:single-strand DNA-binding protein
MASSLNKVMIIGNVGREPELRYTPDGTPTTKFSVAVSRVWNTPEGERKEETEWFNVVTWRKLAETCGNYVYKGQKVYVEGRLQTRKWTDPQGVEKRFVDLIANQVVFLGKPKSQVGAGGEEETAAAPTEEGEEGGNDIPF